MTLTKIFYLSSSEQELSVKCLTSNLHNSDYYLLCFLFISSFWNQGSGNLRILPHDKKNNLPAWNGVSTSRYYYL